MVMFRLYLILWQELVSFISLCAMWLLVIDTRSLLTVANKLQVILPVLYSFLIELLKLL